MLRKSISALVLLILFSLVLGPLGTANAQEPLPLVPQHQSNRPDNHKLPNGAQQDENGTWYIPAGAQPLRLDNPVPLLTGGPDDFGYSWDDTVPLNWVDVTGGTNTGLTGYDATGAITIPFPFKYYENTYSQLYIAASGYLSFTDSYWDNQSEIPNVSEPNNVIAPYWTPTYIGTGSWVRYTSGGTAPNRYFVVEWHDVKGGDPSDTIGGDDTFRFETILYENGDIVFQYQAMTITGLNSWCGAAGIEDSIGLDGLSYVNFCSQAPSFKAVRFYRPPASARVKLDPTEQGSFAVPGETKNLQINILNTGELGSDTYDLFLSTIWPVTFYSANGVTPLTDTDTDGTVDTGPVPQGSIVTITAKVAAPIGVALGDANTATVTARSSLNTTRSKTATLQSAVPAPFAQIYEDFADGAMSLELVQPNAQIVKKATEDGHYGHSPAITATPNGNFVYVWANGRCLDVPCNIYVNDIEYTLLDHSGNTLRAVSKLIDNSGATVSTTDSSPSVAVAPNGMIGLAWYHHLYNSATYQYNDNIYFAVLDASGNMVYGPANITNNSIWGTYNDLNIPEFYSPTIAASDDNRFVIGWNEYKYTGSNYISNIWYATRNSNGTSLFSPTALTSTNRNYDPVLNSLTGGNAILTWYSSVAPNYGTPTYAVLNSSGAISKAATTLGASYVYETPDAVQLPNGKVAVAWPANGGVQYDILNSSYAIESGPNSAYSPSYAEGYGLSVTTDPSSRVIMTWQDAIAYQKLFYALGDSTGTFITQPMIYKRSASGVDTSYNGQGNAPYTINVPAPVVVSSARADADPTSAATVNFTVTFTQNVTGVDASDFSVAAMGVVGATVSGVSGSGSVYTVTVNTGSGAGSIRLDVLDNDSIVNIYSNPLGGAGAGNGAFAFGETYTIIPPPPAPVVVSSARADVDPTGASTVNFTVTFTQNVTGVDVSDFSPVALGVLGSTVSGVSGSGSVYTVTVNTGSGSGSIRLNVLDDDSIVNAFANPIGGVGAGNGTFTFGETYTITKTWIFGDVTNTYWSWGFIERLYNAGITGGCSTIPLNYCPATPVTRAQMAIFLLRGMHGSTYAPPAATGTVFTDVPLGSFAAAWIEQLAAEGITSGCGGSNYCPSQVVTRAQMAIFLVRAKHGVAFVPPTATGLFSDVPVGSFGANHIEQLVTDAITSGCGGSNFCPNTTVKRDSMAVFLVKTFNLP